jgi:hypothetical protein
VTIDELIEQAHRTAVSKGWWETAGEQERSMGDQFANFHAELSEAWEEYRAGHPLDEIRLDRGAKPEGFVVELADVFIRIADTLGAYGLEQAFANALEHKLAYNQTREHRHGGLKA